MILNDEQLHATKLQLGKLESWIAELEAKEKHSSDQLRRMQLDGFYGFAEEAKTDIFEYEELRLGKIESSEPVDLPDLPKLLVLTRIALGWSQMKLAERTNTPISDIERYEANSYLGASI